MDHSESGEPVDSSAVILPVLVDEAGVMGGVPPAETRVVQLDTASDVCPAPDCAVNSTPRLGPVVLERNDTTVSALDEVRLDDTVRILIGVEDAECNVGCGEIHRSYVSPRSGVVDVLSLGPNIPCSTQETNTYLGVLIHVPSSVVPPGGEQYTFTTSVSDACGSRSNEVTSTLRFPRRSVKSRAG
jgi:hypothetical protein